MAMDQKEALVALLQTRPGGLSWADLTAEVIEAGSALAVWDRHVPATLIDPAGSDPLQIASDDLRRWRSEGITVLSILDEEYPARLRDIHQAPPILFTRGRLVPNDRAVSVVGSRKASDRGLDIASNVSRALVAMDVTVVAGLAAGIDTAAHEAALEAQGRTVAVVGTGIHKVYPAQNRALQETVAANGLLISQFWPDAPPQRHTFLMRNATMSGYGIATVVVEAGETSGARAQARMAVEHGRPVILTDLVVERNEWAKQLLARPRVHVAHSVVEVTAIVRGLQSEDSAIESKLEALVSQA
jgi:DNA processing protein